MLIKILKYINDTGVFSISKIAVVFKLEKTVVEGIISRLKEMQYIKVLESTCEEGSCSCGKSCGDCSNTSTLKHVWQLTDKGKRVVKE